MESDKIKNPAHGRAVSYFRISDYSESFALIVVLFSVEPTKYSISTFVAVAATLPPVTVTLTTSPALPVLRNVFGSLVFNTVILHSSAPGVAVPNTTV